MDKEKIKLAKEKARREQLIKQQSMRVRTFRNPKLGEVFYQDENAKYREENRMSESFLKAVKSLSAFRDQSSNSERVRKYGQKDGLILTGILSGAKVTDEYGICAEVLLGEHSSDRQIILIPFSSFTAVTDSQLEAMKVGRRRYIANRSGSQVDFIVTEDIYIAGKRFFLGDRLTAMTLRRYEMWFSEIRETNAENFGKYRFNKGDVIQARVLSVTRNSLLSEVFGIEKLLSAMDVLTGVDRGGDVREFYRPGDVINVMITQLEREKSDAGAKLEVSISASACKTDMNTELFDFISIGDEFEGVIGKIGTGKKLDSTGNEIITKPFVLVNLINGCTVYVPSVPDYAIFPGDRCRVIIKRKVIDEKTGARQLRGFIEHTY